jgi:hypothetical protein
MFIAINLEFWIEDDFIMRFFQDGRCRDFP